MPATVQERLALKPTSRAVLDLIRGSQETLTLENLYYIPDDSFMKGLLRKKRGSGVKINLYSNMFEGSSSKNSIFDDDFEIVSHWQSHYLRKENVGTQTNHAKFRIPGLMDRWHFTPKEASYTYHAKTFVADGKDAIVSSFNIDPRSMHINGESALVVKGCSAFAGRVEETARLTGKIWAAEEEHAVCMGQGRPHPASTDHFSRFIQFISKELQ
jgi:phosphatidylserine/phosphatidylglycerophosphate/cardiolipin synthase-like enzyme